MKNRKKLIGVIALAAVIGFAMAACDNGINPVTDQTPVADDFVIGNLTQTAGNVTTVMITPKAGKSNGAITIYYNGSTTLPTAVGTYPVTFDVAAATGFNAATGLAAGTLMINATTSASQTPVANDFIIGNLTQTAGSVIAVTITPKAGKSGGAITIYYNGSTTLPTSVGTYPVTFDVAAATGFNAAAGLSAGTLTINATASASQTPVADDFVIGNLTPTAGSVVAVTVTPKAGKSTGAITIYYDGETALPATVGTYPVTFDVAAAIGFNAATGLSAGTLTINATNQDPVADDFEISGATTYTYDGSPKSVTITPKQGKSAGTITVYYHDSTTAPSAPGAYTVTFDVAAAIGFNAATGLAAGTLTINAATPVADDFDISGATTYTYDGSPKSVTITPKQGKSAGSITVYYHDSTTAPSAPGAYTVTFDVAAATGFNTATGLSAGTLTINATTPVADDFEISNLNQTIVNITAVTITPKAGKSTGAITIYYNGSTTLPSAVGTYTVTFNVAAATGFNAATGLAAGTLTIIEAHAIGVQFSGFGDEAVDLTKSTENDIRFNEWLIITVDGDFDAYQWYWNGGYQGVSYSNRYEFRAYGWYPIGIHTITAVVTKNGVPYSKEVTFRVVR
jgi:outer membrane lipoprotein-sorting protein